MPNYKELYFKLFAAVSDAMEILNKAQLEAEELYMSLAEENKQHVEELNVADMNEK